MNYGGGGTTAPARKKAKFSIAVRGGGGDGGTTSPDPMRYVRLWDDGRPGRTCGSGSNINSTTSSSTSCAPPPDAAEPASPRPSRHNTLAPLYESELELALCNQRIWERINECQRIIADREREINELRQGARSGHDCAQAL
jgi:hypothetical protein